MVNKRQSFSINALPPQDRLATLKAGCWDRSQIIIDSARTGILRFSASASDFANVHIERTAGTALSTFRRQSTCNLDTEDRYLVSISLKGGFLFRQAGRERQVTSGSMSIFHYHHELEIHRTNPSDDLFIKIPCKILRDRLPEIDDHCAKTVFFDPPLIPAVSQLAIQLLKNDWGEKAPELEAALVDLICLTLETQHLPSIASSTRSAIEDALFEHILNYMQTHYNRHDLSPPMVARAIQISVSSLHRLFQVRGKTFGRTLLQARLEAAHHLLTTGHRALSIGEIANRCGFTSQAHFSTRFREHFGTTPRSIQANPF